LPPYLGISALGTMVYVGNIFFGIATSTIIGFYRVSPSGSDSELMFKGFTTGPRGRYTSDTTDLLPAVPLVCVIWLAPEEFEP
jgi:hypothetical protein